MRQAVRALVVAAAAALAWTGQVLASAPSRADAVAYLVNVTVLPGHHFTNAEEALQYGHGVCGRLAQREGYAQIIEAIKTDFNTSDDFQASYLISQAAQELCPAMIWQLRATAATYRPENQ